MDHFTRQYTIWVGSHFLKAIHSYERYASILFALNTLTVVLDVLSVATSSVSSYPTLGYSNPHISTVSEFIAIYPS